MSESSGPNRLYGEKEIRALLRRASELQESEKRPEAGTAGLTLAEIETMAAELGIDPSLLRVAAAEFELGRMPEDSFRLLRLPRTVRLQRSVPGQLTDEAWPAAVQEIRRTLGSTGQTSQVGTTYEWTSRMDIASVTVTPHSDQTGVHLEYHYTPLVAATMIMVAFYSFMGFGATMENLHWEPLVEWAVSIGGWTGIMAITRQVLSGITRRHRKKLELLVERLDTIVRGQARVQAPEQVALAQPENIPTIDISEPGVSELGPTEAQRARTT